MNCRETCLSQRVSVLDYNEFELQLSKEGDNQYLASALKDGEVVASQTFELRTDELKLIEGLRRLEESAISPGSEETFHVEFGQELYNKVFSGELGEYFRERFEVARDEGAGLRISLRCHADAAKIAALPWEFLHDSEDFLVTKRDLLISRLPIEVRKRKLSPLETTLRMLVVVSSPNDPNIVPLNTELEQEVILEAVDRLQRENKMVVDFSEDATYDTIQGYLNDEDYHIVHFTGHGAYHDGKGYLVFEKEDGTAREVDNRVVADLLAGRGVRLVVLSACQSGKVSNKEAYADLASILAKEGIPAVVAMQYSIADLSATNFASAFYRPLTSGKSVDFALTEARTAMKNAENSNGVDFATPLLYLSDPDCLSVGEIKPESSEILTKPVMLGELQVMKKGFVGRRKELRILQKAFQSDVKRAAIIYGFGGIGKTVLATRLALRMNRHFEGVFGTKCKKTTIPEDILDELNGFLLMDDVGKLNRVIHEQVPLKVKTQILVSILNQRRYLIIFDNFEDCLDDSWKRIKDPALGKFVQQLLNGTHSNTKIIFTTRRNFDPLEGRLTESVEHLSLPELPFPQTVWLMNNHRELADLDTKKKLEIYQAIGGHPWTIGQFAMHAAAESVDSLLLDLEDLQQELVEFTLLDKSYSKLDNDAKRLLLCASVYEEAVPAEALSWIVGTKSQPSPTIGDELKKLLDWGLLAKQDEFSQELYTIHTLVKDFAREEAEKEGLDRKELLIRAAEHYDNLVETTGNLWDLLKARSYYYQAEDWETAADIVEDAYDYLVRWGHIELAMNLLDQSAKTTSSTTKAVALGNLATVYHGLGDWKTALKLHTEVKEIFEQEGQRGNVAVALHQLGIVHQDQGNYKEAVELYQQSLNINEELGDKKGIATTLHQLGNVHYLQGNYKETVELYQQSLNINEELGDKKGIATTLHQLGMVHQDQGNYKEAVELYQQSLNIKEELGDKKGIAETLGQLGRVHEEKDEDYTSALEKYLLALSIFKELNDPRRDLAESLISRLREKMGEEAFEKVLEDVRRKHDA